MSRKLKMYVRVNGNPLIKLTDELTILVKNMPSVKTINEHVISQRGNKVYEPIIIGMENEQWVQMFEQFKKKGVNKVGFVEIILASNMPALIKIMPAHRTVKTETLEQLLQEPNETKEDEASTDTKIQ